MDPIFTEDFKRRILEAYDNSEDMKKMLEAGEYGFVVRYLDDDRSCGISPDAVIQAYESGDFTAIYERAKKIKQFEALYSEWYDAAREATAQKTR